ncbi:MAG: hypothetical protein WA858_23995 [Xanthobacteraceae bacterium]|jgi:hypothetical protein
MERLLLAGNSSHCRERAILGSRSAYGTFRVGYDARHLVQSAKPFFDAPALTAAAASFSSVFFEPIMTGR